MSKNLCIFAAEFKFYVRKVNEKSQEEAFQPSRNAALDVVYQHNDGVGIAGSRGPFCPDLA